MSNTPARSRKAPAAMRWRRYHRWVSTGSMAVLAWVSITGVALGVDVWTSGRTHPEPERASSPLPAAEAPGWISNAAERLSRDAADMTSTRLVLRMTPDGARLSATASGAPGSDRQQFEFAMPDGRLLSHRAIPAERPVPRWRSALHRLLEDLHRGTIIGLPGQLLSLIAGLSFVFLTASGAWMYIDMWKKRRRSGRPGFFWSR
ncbi:PepSY-associated TM helix domain-containing protein [Novosphingobium resinovorum]|uniref:PepSY-associated TM helix domain-containing protein n=1 Tax=Novosphingobium resinovorum TaxID=158500 RepID=UPI002ED6336E|nr:PepSY-associated TM helix domain-containing protein [Novosphingobium resinovorum]